MIRAAAAVALVAAVVLVYAGVGDHQFLAYDDDVYVTDNPNLRQPLDLQAVTRAFATPYETNWIPLTWLSLHLDYAWHGPDAPAFLATNVALHALASALLFLALLRLTGAAGASAFTAGVFAVHPLHVESVAWIAERKDVLAGVFFALVLLAYARSARAPSARSARASRPRHLAAAAALAAGLCAKQSLVPVPLLLVLLDFWPLRRIGAGAAPRLSLAAALREKWLLIAISATASAIALWAQGTRGAMAHGDALPLDVRLANASLSIAAYLRDAVWPTGLAAFYPHPQDAVSRGAATLVALAVLAVTALCFRLRARQPQWLVGWLWLLLMLAPALGLVQVGVQARADRYMYLALTGPVLALAVSVEAWAGASRARRRACAAAALLVLCALALTARRQVAVWRDTETLFAHAADVTEGNFLAEHALGSEKLRRGDAKAAETHFAAAVRMRPSWPEAYLGLADARFAQGRFGEAVADYEHGILLAPRRSRGHLRLARALLASGRKVPALGQARRALELARPAERADAHTVLGAVLLEHRDATAAEREYAQALALHPDLVEALAGRGIALMLLGRVEEGYASIARARATGGDSAALLLAQADAARLLGRIDEARQHLRTAQERALAQGDPQLAADAAQRLAEIR
ncbi:MAG TPA: tetratricopeptide repeat protein [Myxococcota bacterium]|nr:tetratricopeptide repeat protein [Myxococcota bacterium]